MASFSLFSWVQSHYIRMNSLIFVLSRMKQLTFKPCKCSSYAIDVHAWRQIATLIKLVCDLRGLDRGFGPFKLVITTSSYSGRLMDAL
ncbi:hypothetical protein V6N13_074160 [Hibiscus sabdariffa]